MYDVMFRKWTNKTGEKYQVYAIVYIIYLSEKAVLYYTCTYTDAHFHT